MGRVALALHGGGFLGAKQVGVAKELFARKTPSVIQGVSVGALNAAGLVEIGSEGIEARWRAIERKGPSCIFNWKAAAFHVLTPALFSDYGLDELVRQMDIQKIINSPIELQVVARNETSGELRVFSNLDEQILKNPEIMRKAIKASASLPGFFPAVEIEGKWYSDGYYFNLERLADCETVFLVFNEEPSINKDLHNESCFKRMFVGFSEVLDDMVQEHIEKFLEHHPEFDKIKIDADELDMHPINRVAKKLIASGKKLLGLGRQFAAIKPSYSIPTLMLDTFRQPSKNQEGDISKAIRLSQEQAKKFLDQIEL